MAFWSTASKTSRCAAPSLASRQQHHPAPIPRIIIFPHSSVFSLARSLISLLSTATSRRIQTLQVERERQELRAPPQPKSEPRSPPLPKSERTRTGGEACGTRTPRRPPCRARLGGSSAGLPSPSRPRWCVASPLHPPLPSSRNRIPRFLARRLTPRPAAFLPQRGGAVASGGVGPSIRGLICSCG